MAPRPLPTSVVKAASRLNRRPRFGEWPSLVRRLTLDQEIGGSNPPSPASFDRSAILLDLGRARATGSPAATVGVTATVGVADAVLLTGGAATVAGGVVTVAGGVVTVAGGAATVGGGAATVVGASTTAGAGC